MGKVRCRAMIVAGILLACCVCASGLNPSLDISQYAHTAWKARDGFVRGSINDLAQTPDGYLWLGTEFGLVRFDGVKATPWQPPRPSRPPGMREKNAKAPGSHSSEATWGAPLRRANARSPSIRPTARRG